MNVGNVKSDGGGTIKGHTTARLNIEGRRAITRGQFYP